MNEWIAVGILLLVMGLLVSGRVRIDFVGVIALALVGIFHLVSTSQLFSGFSSYAAIILAEMFVLGEALRLSGVTDRMAGWFERIGKGGETRLLTALMVLPPIPSTFISDVGLMSIFLPTMGRIRQKLQMSLHRILMPLAFAIALGGLLSMIGSAGNIIGNSALTSSHYAPIPLFGITPLGAILVVAGFLYMRLWGIRRLPAKDIQDEFLTNYQEVKDYLTEVAVSPQSPLVGKPLKDDHFFRQNNLSIVRILRDQGKTIVPGGQDMLMAGDRIIVQGNRDSIMALAEQDGMALTGSDRSSFKLRNEELHVVEAMIPNSSLLANHSLKETHFRARFGVSVLAILRQGVTHTTALPDLRLSAGDVLLVMGTDQAIERVQETDDLIVFGAVEKKAAPSVRHQLLAAGVVVVVLALAALNILAIQVAAAAGIGVLVVSRLLSLDRAYRAIDWRIITLVGGITPLSIALTKTGVTGAIAHLLLHVMGHLGPYAILAVFFVLAAVLTQVISNVAAALVLSPMAISVAAANHWSPDGLIIAMVVALSAAPITPLANKVFIMAMAPGHYKYQDFLRIGLPLTLVMFVLTVVLTPVFFPLVR